MSSDDLGPSTILQHFGEEGNPYKAIAPPIVQASNFWFESVDEYYATNENLKGGEPYTYSRVSNPTVEIAEAKIAKLEGADRCRLTGSGMGAITLALQSELVAGSHVVAVDTCYGPVKELLNNYFPKFDITSTYVDGLTVESVVDAIRPETRVVYLESPSTFVFRLQNLRAIAKACRDKGIVTMIDNTYCSPLYQNPIEYGIDVVLHTGSKYLGGHSDLIAGAICSTEERMRRILKYEINLYGAALAPFPAWLLLRGLRTLPIRIKRHEETANVVAKWLSERREVKVVHHVSLPTFPQAELYRSQMRGSTGLFSFEVKNQDSKKLKRFIDSLEIFQLAVSWGGYESLAMLVLTQPMGYAKPRWIIRLFCGLEEPEDLIRDLEQAFDKSEL